MSARVVDNDRDQITVVCGDRLLRSYAYDDEAERRIKIGKAREYVEGWYAAGDMREVVEAATKLVSQWDAFEAGYGNQEEAYYKLAKYARPHWEALRTALRSITGAKP